MKSHKRMIVPYIVWMGILVLIPTLLMIILVFIKTDGFIFDFNNARISVYAFEKMFSSVYLRAFKDSFTLAFLATILCIILGYPLAYVISRIKSRFKFALLLLLVFPMFTNMLLQISTIRSLFEPISILNNIGISLDINKIGTKVIVVLVMVMMYLPFMVFPIYTVLEKIDPLLIEAAADLGANNFKTFTKVTLPLSMKGVSSGVIMVFLPCASGFVIPRLVSSGSGLYLIGEAIESAIIGQSIDYGLGSLLSSVILLLVLGALWLISKVDAEGETLL